MSNTIGDDYYNTMDRDYLNQGYEPRPPGVGISISEKEGRLTNLLPAKIRTGAESIEVGVEALPQGPSGAESYSKEARQELKKLAEINEVKIQSIHTPPHFIGFAGFDPQQHQFSEHQREATFNEGAKTIDFAKDISEGANIVLHLGEFNRSIAGGYGWGEGKPGFEAFEGESKQAMITFADKETGRIQQLSRDTAVDFVERYTKEQVETLKGLTAEEKKQFKEMAKEERDNMIGQTRWVKEYERDERGNYVPDELDPTKRKIVEKPKMIRVDWNYFNSELQGLIKEKGEVDGRQAFKQRHNIPVDWEGDLPTRAFIGENIMNQIAGVDAQLKRWSAGNETLKIQRKHFLDEYKNQAEDETKSRRELNVKDDKTDMPQHFTTDPRSGLPILKSEKLANQLKEIDEQLRYNRELAEEYSRNKEKLVRDLGNLTTIEDVAVKRSADTIAKLGVVAMEKSTKLKKPIVMTPENLGPHSFGSHPKEMIEIITKARGQMVDRLTKKEIEDPLGRTEIDPSDPTKRRPMKILNPFFKPEFEGNEKKAQKFAEKHIKATLDTQHLQMWMQHFKRLPGETEDQREKRFYDWYNDQIKKLKKSGIVGHVHLVEGFGRDHVHLPFGSSRMITSEAIDELRAMGAPIISEGFQEGPSRQLSSAWEATGHSLYGLPGGDYQWSQISDKYLGGVNAPPYLFGELATDPEDFKMWSEIPLE